MGRIELFTKTTKIAGRADLGKGRSDRRGREQQSSFVNIHLKCLQDSQMEMGSGKLDPALEFGTDI